jgi:hypothetical protein
MKKCAVCPNIISGKYLSMRRYCSQPCKSKAYYFKAADRIAEKRKRHSAPPIERALPPEEWKKYLVETAQ